MDKELLEVRDLDIAYCGGADGRPVLKGVDFTLREGETLGVVGVSGAGKSTLAMAVAGLLSRDMVNIKGTVNFVDCNLLDLSEGELRRYRGSRIAMIFQDPVASLDPAQRVVDQVAEVFLLHEKAGGKEARELAMRELDNVGISRETLRFAPYSHQLSGGQCQRVMIAAALAGKPDLLIADEPTSSLDVILQARIVQMLKDRQEQSGMSMIFISHDLPLVSTLADKIVVLSEGKVVEQGNCEQVLNNPRHDLTVEMINAGMVKVPWGATDAATA